MLARTKSPQPAVSPKATEFLEVAAATFRSPARSSDSSISFGVDLGTATIVLTAVDEQGHPVYWDSLPCQAVRDGVVGAPWRVQAEVDVQACAAAGGGHAFDVVGVQLLAQE